MSDMCPTGKFMYMHFNDIEKILNRKQKEAQRHAQSLIKEADGGEYLIIE